MEPNGLNAVATIVDCRDRYDYRRRDNDSCLEEMIANGVQRLQHDVADQSSKVGDKINAAMAQDNANARSMEHMICATERNLAEGQREVQRDVVENKHVIKDAQCSIEREVMQNRVDLLKTESKLIERLDYETDIIKERLNGFERSVDHQFCDVKGNIKDSERRILDRLTADKLDEKNNIIDELRHERRQSELIFSQKEQQLAFSNQLNLLHSQLIDLSQNQKATNQAINFGTGLIGQAATNNQVR